MKKLFSCLVPLLFGLLGLLLVLGLLSLTGCSSIDLKGSMQNRVTVSLACDRAFLASLYGPVGITSEIDGRDLAQLPCASRDRAAAAPGAAPAPAK